MKATLYEALGLQRTASTEEVRSALRSQIRKYYANTRDGHGNVEEALRFINHASCILGDSERRARYDRELAAPDASLEQRIAHVVKNVVAPDERQPDGAVAAGAPAAAERREEPVSAPPKSLHPGLTERVASLPHTSGIAVMFCTVFAILLATAIVFRTPADAVLVAKQGAVGLGLALLLMGAVYAAVHAMVKRREGAARPLGANPYEEHAILNWRREKSVFLGLQQPQEDAGWVFQLRMAELERAKSGRTSRLQPWNRLVARLFDYALWGLGLGLSFANLNALGIVPVALAFWLTHPLIAPILITATWIPLEALLTAHLHTTPGKWLFGIYLQFSISDAYAQRDSHAGLRRAFRRACAVWWEGIACGIPLLAPVFVAIAYEKLKRERETAWDAALDCLVTHSPPSRVNTATGAVGLIAMAWLYGVAWQPVMDDSIARARSSVMAALPSPSSLLQASSAVGSIVARDSATSGASVSGGKARNASSSTAVPSDLPIDPVLAQLFADRRARINDLQTRSRRMLESHNWEDARELCRAWTDLDLGNPQAWRCLGESLQREGKHQEAIKALRKAKHYDPGDRALDAAIARSQRAILAQFLSSAR